MMEGRRDADCRLRDIVARAVQHDNSRAWMTTRRVDLRVPSCLQKLAPPLHVVAWLNSPPRTLEQLRGKVVLIDFWGVGCGPCVAVIGLHSSGIERAELQAFAKEHKLTYPLAIAAPDDERPSWGVIPAAEGALVSGSLGEVQENRRAVRHALVHRRNHADLVARTHLGAQPL
jgi:hypothetical protein